MPTSTTTKSTHGYPSKMDLWAPIVKDGDGKYLAVLSDDSTDRDGEIIGKSWLQKMSMDDGYLATLANHTNDIFMKLGRWTNKRLEKVRNDNGEEFLAFVAELKWYESNPNAKIAKDMMDEGAEFGVSIGAIPSAHKITKRNGKEYREYTDGELLEASLVAIPANKHAHAVAIMKSFHSSQSEVNKMTEEKITELTKQLDITTKEKESLESKHADLSKRFAETEESLAKANEELVAKEALVVESAAALEKSIAEKEALEKKLVEATTTITELQKEPSFHKGFNEPMNNEKPDATVQKGMPVIYR